MSGCSFQNARIVAGRTADLETGDAAGLKTRGAEVTFHSEIGLPRTWEYTLMQNCPHTLSQ
ncbi:MAG TPA: hypothetical protein VGV18_08475 [Verrucomicrobiae bacterium]|nr:hypothetical protein [Verrucomicrobiae bacterium]